MYVNDEVEILQFKIRLRCDLNLLFLFGTIIMNLLEHYDWLMFVFIMS